MIGRLTGKLIKKQAPSLMLDVNGVGYELDAPMTTFYQLPEIGSQTTLHTHLLVREDAQLLYGFFRESDRTIFRTLIKINGVGAKLALALMSGMTAQELTTAVQTDDTAAFIRVPGVGKKTAERLIVELRDRIDSWQPKESAIPNSVRQTLMATDHVKDAVSALIALGYKPAEASRMISKVETTDIESDEIVKQALKAVTC